MIGLYPVVRKACLSTLVKGIVLASIFGAPAHAAPKCDTPIATLQKKFDSGDHMVKLTPGQLNFARGAYTVIPPIGLPPGDGAVLITRNGKEGGVVLWTKGPIACTPMQIPEEFLRILVGTKTGPIDAEGSEL